MQSSIILEASPETGPGHAQPTVRAWRPESRAWDEQVLLVAQSWVGKEEKEGAVGVAA